MKQLLLLFLFLPQLVYLQPIPCEEDPPMMTPTCLEACIICDIDSFTGRHESNIPGEAPEDFCTFFVHNAQWIAFIAGSEELSVSMSVSNCQLGAGLEIAIYEAIDCENFRAISNCFGAMSSIGPGESGIVEVNEPLVVGQYYYLVMDGAMGDNCDWTLTVLEGSTQVAPLSIMPEISGPVNNCPEVVSTYTTPGVSGGTDYNWTLNGTSIGDEQSVDISWPGPGVFELCLDISNACDEAPQSCTTIVVESIPVTAYDIVLCEGECFTVNEDTELCEAGLFEFNFPTIEGCDSIVTVDLAIFESTTTQLDVAICEGDSLYVGTTPYFTTGTHVTILDNYLGCDSTVTLDLNLIVCEIEGESTAVPVVCNGEANGQINFQVENGTPPFSYVWEQLGSNETGTGNISAINTIVNIDNLVAGTYLINISDNFGNELVLIQEVTEPSILDLSLFASDYNGWNVSCDNGQDGSIEALPTGGVLPYSYLWSNGEQTSTINELTAGDYTVQLTDAGGCSLDAMISLNSAPELITSVDFINPDCDGANSGLVNVVSTSGGTTPYLYELNNSGFQENNQFGDLAEGLYTLSVEDANGCMTDTTSALEARVIPIIDAGADTVIDLAESILLSPVANVPLDSVIWSPTDGLSCTDCPFPKATPYFSTTYTLSVTSLDGCTTLDSVFIAVEDVRDVFIPNAFSPNNDGINDALFVYGGPEVEQILNFKVFNRWGSLIAENEDILPNSNQAAWDGRFNGEVLGADIFVWSAEILFVDGVIRTYSGDVLLLK